MSFQNILLVFLITNRNEMASAAVALGACLIEKHLTLDKTKIGMDNQMANEPAEMSQLVQNCHNVQIALGGREIVQEAELEQRERIEEECGFNQEFARGRYGDFDRDLDEEAGTGIPRKKFLIWLERL